MRHPRLAISLALTLPVLFNCSSDSDDDSTVIGDGGFITPDGGINDSGRPDSGPRPPRPDAGFPDAGTRRDMNDSIAEAQMAMLNQQNPIRAALNPAGDRDFYAFDMNEGQYLIAFTDTADNNGTRTDPVLRLYDSSEALVAENDDSFPRVDVDSELIYRIPATGTYYLEVLEWSDWSPASMGAEGGPRYTYSLVLRTLSDRNEGVNVDLEPGDDVASAMALEYTQNNNAQIAGTLERTDDTDWFTATFAFAGLLRFDVMPAGPMGYGSTTTGGNITVTNVDTASVTASLDLSVANSLRMPMEPGNYAISIDHAGDAIGANDFYFIKSFTVTENGPAPAEPNDTIATAGALTLEDDGMGTRQSFILTRIEDNDIDVFSFEVMSGELPSVVCGAEGSGSGVRGLTLELLDTAEAVIGMTVEMSPAPAFIDQTASSPGIHYVRMSKTGQDPNIDGNWVRCAIRSGPMN